MGGQKESLKLNTNNHGATLPVPSSISSNNNNNNNFYPKNSINLNFNSNVPKNIPIGMDRKNILPNQYNSNNTPTALSSSNNTLKFDNNNNNNNNNQAEQEPVIKPSIDIVSDRKNNTFGA